MQGLLLTYSLPLFDFLSAISDENMQHEVRTLWSGNGSFKTDNCN